MERLTIPPDTSTELSQTLQDLMDNALGVPNVLTGTEPTTASGILSDGQLSFFSGSLYLKISGTVYKISLTAV